jgi:hypothetical protein
LPDGLSILSYVTSESIQRQIPAQVYSENGCPRNCAGSRFFDFLLILQQWTVFSG